MNETITERTATELAGREVVVSPQAVNHQAINLATLLLQDTRKATTRRAYAAGLRHFFAASGYINPAGGPDPHPAQIQAFLAQGAGPLSLALSAYKAGMREANLSPATMNLRLSAVRALITFAHRAGYCAVGGRGLVDSEKAEAYRDTRGTDLANIKRLLALPDMATPRGRRDAAILRLLCVKALRRAELCGLDVAHFDAQAGRLAILGKGETQRREISLPPHCAQSIRDYLASSGHADGPLFRSLDRRPAMAGHRLTPDGLYKLVGAYGKKLGLKLAPHKLRHSAITIFLDASGGNVLEAQGLSRHKDIRTLSKYDDNRKDRGGQASKLLEDLLDG